MYFGIWCVRGDECLCGTCFILQEELESTDESDEESSSRSLGESDSSTLVALFITTRVVVTGLGLLLSLATGELAADDIGVLEFLPWITAESLGTLEVGITTDFLESRQLDTILCVSNGLVEETTTKKIKRNILLELSGNVESTSDELEAGETFDILEGRVVGKLQATLDGLKFWHGDVHDHGVASEDKVTSGSEVGSADVHEEVGVETEETIHLVKGRQRGITDVAEGHVVSTLEVGEFDGKALVVGSEVQVASNVGHLVDVNFHQVRVVGDHEVADSLKIETLEGGEIGVGDEDRGSLGNGAGESKGLELWQSFQREGLDLGQRTQIKGSQGCAGAEAEGITNAVQIGSRKLSDAGVLGLERAGNLLDTSEGDGGFDNLADDDVSVPLLAAAQCRDILLVLNGEVSGAVCC